MSLGEVATGVLLAVGVLGFAFTSLGLLFSRDVYDQIHYLAPGSILGASAFVAAILTHEGLSQSGAKALLVLILLLLSNPVLSHAIARAARIRRNRQVPLKPGEEAPFMQEAE